MLVGIHVAGKSEVLPCKYLNQKKNPFLFPLKSYDEGEIQSWQ